VPKRLADTVNARAVVLHRLKTVWAFHVAIVPQVSGAVVKDALPAINPVWDMGNDRASRVFVEIRLIQ